MKKGIIVIVAILMALMSDAVSAKRPSVKRSDVKRAQASVTLDADLLEALPNGEFFLPAPPAVGSLIWQDDSVKYFQYKQDGLLWDSVRQERWDSAWACMNEPYYFALYRVSADSVMNAPFISVSWTRTSAGNYSVTYTRNTTDFPQMNALQELCEQMKTENTSHLWRTRPRPYKYFGTYYKGRKYSQDLSDASSYPSGHGYFAGLFGACMLYIDPANALAIKKMMDEWVNCRLLLGAHWNTDIDAGIHLGAIAFTIAMNYPQFRNLVVGAKAELEAYRAQQQQPEDPTGDEPAAVTERQDGKTIENGRLVIYHDGETYDVTGIKN